MNSQTDGQTKPLIELHFATKNHLAPGEGGLKIKIHIKKFSERRIQSTFDGNCLRVVGTSGLAGIKAGIGISNPVSGSHFSLPDMKQELAGIRNLEF